MSIDLFVPEDVELTTLLDELRNLSWTAADILMAYARGVQPPYGFPKELHVQQSDDGPVSAADLAVNTWLLDGLNTHFPNAPWQLLKDDKERAGDVLNILVLIIAKIAIFLAPIMPNISENILNKIGLSIKKLSMKDISGDNFLNIDYKIEKPEIIFQKIE